MRTLRAIATLLALAAVVVALTIPATAQAGPFPTPIICIWNAGADVVTDNDPNQAGAVVNYTIFRTGSCGTITCSPPAGSFFPLGSTTVTCTRQSNGDTDTKTVTVNDTQPPNITAPPDQTANTAPGGTTAVVNYPPPTASDNAPGVTTLCTPASGSQFPVGETIVTCVATDTSGNTKNASFKVTVVDAEAPNLTVPGDIEVTAPAGQSSAAVNFAPTATDNVGIPTTTCDPASGASFPAGTTKVTCTARDAAGNTTTKTFNVVVKLVQTAAGLLPGAVADKSSPLVSSASSLNPAFAPGGQGVQFSARRKRVPRGTKFRYTLSEAARVEITIEQRVRGRRVRGRCRARRKNGRRCTLYVRRGRSTVQGVAGRNSTPFNGKVRRRALKVGRYRARIVAVDAAGNRSVARLVNFRILKG
jgi:hypothetical protein